MICSWNVSILLVEYWVKQEYKIAIQSRCVSTCPLPTLSNKLTISLHARLVYIYIYILFIYLQFESAI
jgi:hypothetical protein